MSSLSSISVVMPVYNEELNIGAIVPFILKILRANDELLIVDGESTDQTVSAAMSLIEQHNCGNQVRVLSARKGRANQMNQGARQAKGDLLVFLHADTLITEQAWAELLVCLETAKPGARFWGRFDVTIQGQSKWLPLVAWFMNRRSRLSRIATGDQVIFVTRALFSRIGGYFDQPLMEDIELCKTLKTQPDALFLPLSGPVLTSGRRWDEYGAWPTILLMWRFRWRYWRGANAFDLARQYSDVRTPTRSLEKD